MEKQAANDPKKFLFDINDFGEDAIRKKLEDAKRPTFSQGEMEASRQTGFEEGKIAGINETIASQEAHIRDLLQHIVMAATRLEENESKRMATFTEQSTLLTAQALSKTIPVLLDVMSVEQISSFIKNILDEHLRAQSINIYVAPEHQAQVQERLEKLLETRSRKIECKVLADNNLNGLQCRFEWTGGGAEWNPGVVADKLMTAIVSHLPEHMRKDVAPAVIHQEVADSATDKGIADSATEARAPATIDETAQSIHTEPNSPGEAP